MRNMGQSTSSMGPGGPRRRECKHTVFLTFFFFITGHSWHNMCDDSGHKSFRQTNARTSYQPRYFNSSLSLYDPRGAVVKCARGDRQLGLLLRSLVAQMLVSVGISSSNSAAGPLRAQVCASSLCTSHWARMPSYLKSVD